MLSGSQNPQGPEPPVSPQLYEREEIPDLVARNDPRAWCNPQLRSRGDISAVAKRAGRVVRDMHDRNIQRFFGCDQACIEFFGLQVLVELLEVTARVMSNGPLWSRRRL